MKKCSFVALLSATLLATLMLPLVRGGYPGPDYYSHCIHFGNFNTPGDTWTGVGIVGTHGSLPPAYVAGDWYFQRGYGGQGSHLYVTDGPFVCVYQYGDYSFVRYEYGTPTRQNRSVPGYGYVDAWYQDWEKHLSSFNPSRQPSLQGSAQSYFRDPATGDRWYINTWGKITASS